MNSDKKEQIATSLRNKEVNLPCPRCSKVKFEVVGQTLLSLNEHPSTITIGGPALPTAIIACSNCGFISLHALSALDLMPSNDPDGAT